jgi:hypothetical protein
MPAWAGRGGTVSLHAGTHTRNKATLDRSSKVASSHDERAHRFCGPVTSRKGNRLISWGRCLSIYNTLFKCSFPQAVIRRFVFPEGHGIEASVDVLLHRRA